MRGLDSKLDGSTAQLELYNSIIEIHDLFNKRILKLQQSDDETCVRTACQLVELQRLTYGRYCGW
jgi:hypothetical protein